MDPATLLIICFVAARFLVNGYQDGKLAAQGKEPPRWERAKAKAAARADGTKRSWWDPIGGYLHSLWSDAFSHQAKKHDVKHGDRFRRWEERRRRKQENKAKRKRHTTDTAPEPPKPGGEPPKNHGGSPGPGPKPPVTPGGDLMSDPNAIPGGEVNNLPAAKIAMSGWRKWCNSAKAMIETAKASVETWQKAFTQANAHIEQTTTLFKNTHKVPAEGHAALARAKEKVTLAAGSFSRISQEYVQSGESLAAALANFDEVVKVLRKLEPVREAAAAAGAQETTAEFVNSGG